MELFPWNLQAAKGDLFDSEKVSAWERFVAMNVAFFSSHLVSIM